MRLHLQCWSMSEEQLDGLIGEQLARRPSEAGCWVLSLNARVIFPGILFAGPFVAFSQKHSQCGTNIGHVTAAQEHASTVFAEQWLTQRFVFRVKKVCLHH